MRLNFLNAVCLPFFSKAFRFGCLAFRAITLTSIGAIVCVPIRAMGFLRVNVCARGRVAFRIFRRGDRIQMLRIYACPISAHMIHNETGRDRLVSEVHCNTMSLTACSPESDYAVTIPVLLSVPYFAIAYQRPLAVESLNFFRRCVAHIYPFSLDSVAYKVSMLEVAL